MGLGGGRWGEGGGGWGGMEVGGVRWRQRVSRMGWGAAEYLFTLKYVKSEVRRLAWSPCIISCFLHSVTWQIQNT